MWTAATIQIGIALFVLLLNQVCGLIRQQTVLPAFFYLLFVGSNPLYFNDIRACIVALFVLICLFFLVRTYQNPQSQREAFNIALSLSAGAWYWPPLLVLFPLFWYGMHRMRSLNAKTFLASLLGLIFVAMIVFTWVLYCKDDLIVTEKTQQFRDLFFMQPVVLKPYDLLRFFVILLLIILAEIKILTVSISEKIFTKIIFEYLFIFALLMAGCYILQPQSRAEWGLIFQLPCALLLSHYFTMAQRKWQAWLFFGVILFFVLFFLGFWGLRNFV
ncbi:hypothetical protein FACS189413_01460 [Bacteroidia bacterium]|nr:hypothetical protein FACS189413_01460 [Bacteroidia bacterium]